MATSNKPTALRRAAVVGITLIVLLIPCALYYLFYVQSQQAYFIDQSHRALDGIGKQVAARIDGLRDVVEKAATRQCQTASEEDAEDLNDLENYFEPLAPFGVGLTLESYSSLSAEEINGQSSATANPPITVEFGQSGSHKRLRLNYEVTNQEVTPESKLRPGRFSISTKVDDLLIPVADRYLIRERKLAAEDMFDQVLVADSDTGEVVFQYGPDLPIIVSNSNELGTANSSGSAKTGEKDDERGNGPHGKVGREMSGMIPVTIANIDYKLFYQPIQLIAPKHVKDVAEVSNLFEKYDNNKDGKITAAEFGDKRLFTSLDLNKDGELTLAEAGAALKQTKKSGDDEESRGFKLTVFGLVRANYAFKKTLAFTSYMLLLFAVLSILVITGSGPLIKLKLLGPKDRLCKRDAVFAVLSAYLVTALLTLGMLDVYMYVNLANQLDQQLAELAGTLTGNLRGELTAAVDQLDQFNNELEDKRIWALPECPSSGGQSGTTGSENTPPESKGHVFVEDILNKPFILDQLAAPYPYFNSVTWIDYDGQQQIKFTTRLAHTRFIDVTPPNDPPRVYFTEAKEGRTWTLPNEKPGEKPRDLYLESVHSMTTGDNVAVIAKQRAAAGDANERFVSAMETRLLSLYGPVLPTGYGFCIIDKAGNVLFHSDDSKNLLENFFEECRNDRGLRAATQTRISESLDVKYLGRDHSACVTPIEGLPWTLVVFRDKYILRTMNLETMTLAAYLILAYAVVLTLALAFTFIFVPGSKERLKAIWPLKQHRDRYKQMFIVNSALFLMCVLLTAISNRQGFLYAILFPSIAIAHSLWLLGRRKPKLLKLPDLSWFSEWRRAYTLALASMLAVGCVAPTFAFFKLMRDEQIKVFLRHGQMSLATKLLERTNRVHSLYPAPDSPTEEEAANKKAFIEKRLASTWDVDEDFFFKTTSNEQTIDDQGPLGGVLCWFLMKLSPFYNEVCVESLHLALGRATDKTWTSSEAGDSVLLALRPVTSPPSSADSASADAPQEQILRTTIPPLVAFSNPLWLLVSAFVLMAIAAYFAVRFAARRIVLLDLEDVGLWSLNPGGKIDQNYLVVGAPSLERSKLFLEHPCIHIDLASSSKEAWWEIKYRIDKDESKDLVVLNCFDTNKDDFKWNELKLTLVERLLRENTKRLVIISSGNPVDLPLSAPASEVHETAPDPKSAKALSAGAGTAPISSPAPVDKPAPLSSPAPANKPDPQRWSEVLSSFTRRAAVDGDDPKARGLLKAANQSVDPISREPERPEDEELVAKEADQLEIYYRGIWAACSQDEKMTLFRVAKDGLVGRFDPHLRPLMLRGLIVRDPSLAVKSPSFRMFVLKTCVADGVDRLQADEMSHWERWKLPLILVVVAMISFLFITQRELFDNTVYIVTGVTGGLMALLRLVGMVQPKSGGGAGSEA